MVIEKLIKEFMNLIAEGKVEVYNEFSLQHELGIYLREKMPGYKVQFERNTKFFEIDGLVKHEIDIVIYDGNEKHAIELKYPLNGQYPEQMFSFIKDIKFMEQLKENGFESTYCLTLVQDKVFYSGDKKDGIYAYFRSNAPIHGTITKPTGKRDETILVNGSYCIKWETCGEMHFYLQKIS